MVAPILRVHRRGERLVAVETTAILGALAGTDAALTATPQLLAGSKAK